MNWFYRFSFYYNVFFNVFFISWYRNGYFMILLTVVLIAKVLFYVNFYVESMENNKTSVFTSFFMIRFKISKLDKKVIRTGVKPRTFRIWYESSENWVDWATLEDTFHLDNLMPMTSCLKKIYISIKLIKKSPCSGYIFTQIESNRSWKICLTPALDTFHSVWKS